MSVDATCSECGDEHPRADAIEEAEQNGWPIEEAELTCRTCGSTIEVQREVEEL